MRLSPLLLALFALPALAADPRPGIERPEIERPDATPQAVGARHTLRTIPEACARIEGEFTGRAADPYAFSVVRTSTRCQPRARLVDAAKVQPQTQAGWIFNDRIRVPSAVCASQAAVVEVWRKPVASARPTLDAQGSARIYLEDAMQSAGEAAPAIPMFAVAMSVEGEPCR